MQSFTPQKVLGSSGTVDITGGNLGRIYGSYARHDCREKAVIKRHIGGHPSRADAGLRKFN